MTPIKLEVGGVYRTRGSEEIVVITFDKGGEDYPFIGAPLYGNEESWCADGSYMLGPDEHAIDIVEHLGNITDLPAVKALTSTPESK